MNAQTAALNDLTEKAAGEQPQDALAPKLNQTFFVLDTTAQQPTGHDQEDKAKGRGARTHLMPILDGKGGRMTKPYKFEPGVPLELPLAIAVKFLKIDGFVRTDENGNPLPYSRQPKQPEELGPGERFVLEDHQTVADYGELTMFALLQRALELPAGEAFKDSRDRNAIMAFIKDTAIKRREANKEKLPARAARPASADDSDEFIPAPGNDAEMGGDGGDE